MSKTFCTQPWSGISFFPDGSVGPCCHSQDSLGENIKSYKSIKDYLNSPRLLELKKKMLLGQKDPYCMDCYKKEDRGITSPREQYNLHYSQEMNEVLKTDKTHGQIRDIQFLELRFTNDCNYSCRICGPHSSTRWQKELNKTDEYKSIDFSSFQMEELYTIAENVDLISFAGGEPLITEEHYVFLKNLINKGLVDIDLQYNTNLSTLKYKGESYLDLWKNFKGVAVGASIDGIFERGEYQRKGQNWNKTLKSMWAIKESSPNISLYIHLTVSLFNAFHVPEMMAFFLEEKLLSQKDFNLNLLATPNYYSIKSLPQDYKEKLKGKYIHFIKTYLLPQYDLKDCARLIKLLKDILRFSEDDSSNNLDVFKTITEEIDYKRKEDFKKTFPEYADLYK